MLRRKRRLHKWIAIMLSVLLLAGQSDAFVRAEEGVGDESQTEISSQEAGTGTTDPVKTTGGDNTENPDKTTDGDNTENPDNTAGGDNAGNADNGLDQGDNNGDADNKDTGDQQGAGDPQKQCTCETKCKKDAVKTDCPVCATDYEACAGKDDTEVVPGADDKNTGDSTEGGDSQDQCICETACTEGALNADCPVCAAGADLCAKNVGGGVNPAEGEPLAEALIANEDIATLAEEGVGAYVNGDKFSAGLLRYRVIDDEAGEVEAIEPGSPSLLPKELIIPATVKDDYNKGWNVTGIDEWAFRNCRTLENVKIECGITRVGFEAFNCCTSLKSVTIPESVTEIEGRVFSDCLNLEEVIIQNNMSSIIVAMFYNCGSLSKIIFPENITAIEGHIIFPQNITAIEGWAFGRCYRLTEVTIPSTITAIGTEAFKDCSRLEKVTISDSVTVSAGAFSNCGRLTTLEIAVSRSDPLLVEDETVFKGYPASLSRKLVFKNADGTAELTGSQLARAQLTYLNAPDGNTDDDEWYGWSIDRPDTYSVTIDVKKDGVEWADHGKKYALKEDGDTEFISDLAHVPNGTYSIYDITGISADSLSAMARDTGMDTNVDVTVPDAEAPDREVKATINYYTATFYDGAEAYGTDTPQRPQIILSGKQVAEPTSPSKSGHTFTDWKTQDGGNISFNFGEPIGAKTAIYASWQGTDTPVTAYIITASADEGGSISPSGRVSVNKGDSQTFTITPKEGNRIKAVTVDGIDRTAELMETPTGARYYTFTNITGNHTIYATFESDGSNPGGGGDNPNPGGGDNPNPGDGGSGDNPNPGSEDSTGNVQVTVVSETASPQAENSAVADMGTPQASKGQENAASATGQKANGKGTASDGKEPKTGDTNYLEVYATLAMIAGLTWLLLCFMDEARGMSEREKEVFVAAFIRWGKKGGAFRKCCAMAAIFCLLAYYHTIGKRVDRNALPENYLGQAS